MKDDNEFDKYSEHPLVPKVMARAVITGHAAATDIQRKYAIGYVSAFGIIEYLASVGYITRSNGDSLPRTTLMTAKQYADVFGKTPEDVLAEEASASSNDPATTDPFIPGALAYAIKKGGVSVSSAQRYFSVGYARMARVIDGLDKLGYVLPPENSYMPRRAAMTEAEFEKKFGCGVDECLDKFPKRTTNRQSQQQ